MYTVAKQPPRNRQRQQFLRFERATLVDVEPIERLPHELHELVPRHDAVHVFVHHAYQCSAVAAVRLLTARADRANDDRRCDHGDCFTVMEGPLSLSSPDPP